MKRVCAIIIALFILLVSVQMPVISEEVDYTSRSDFSFGINIHDFEYNSYPEMYLDEQVHLVAKAGCKMIRINGGFSSNMSYLDRLVGLCNKYGLKIVMVMGVNWSLGDEYITRTYKAMAERYNGKEGRGFVDYIQCWNETDATLMEAKYGASGRSGKSMDEFYTIPVDGAADLPEYTEYFRAAEKGIHEADSDTKFMINFCFTHWGTILWYLKEGVKIDAVGWDYYPYKGNMEEHNAICKTEFDEYYEQVYKKYNIPVIICETNTLNQKSQSVIKTVEDSHVLSNYDYLMTIIDEAYKRDWMKGLIIYELLDEPSLGTGAEAHWGMVDCERGGLIGEPKPIYNKLQSLWKGNNNLTKYKKESIDLKPYEKFIVDTAEDIGDQSVYQPIPDITVSDTPAEVDTYFETETDIDDGEETVQIEPETTVRQMNVIKRRSEIPWVLTISVCGGIIVITAGLLLILKLKKII